MDVLIRRLRAPQTPASDRICTAYEILADVYIPGRRLVVLDWAVSNMLRDQALVRDAEYWKIILAVLVGQAGTQDTGDRPAEDVVAALKVPIAPLYATLATLPCHSLSTEEYENIKQLLTLSGRVFEVLRGDYATSFRPGFDALIGVCKALLDSPLLLRLPLTGHANVSSPATMDANQDEIPATLLELHEHAQAMALSWLKVLDDQFEDAMAITGGFRKAFIATCASLIPQLGKFLILSAENFSATDIVRSLSSHALFPTQTVLEFDSVLASHESQSKARTVGSGKDRGIVAYQRNLFECLHVDKATDGSEQILRIIPLLANVYIKQSRIRRLQISEASASGGAVSTSGDPEGARRVEFAFIRELFVAAATHAASASALALLGARIGLMDVMRTCNVYRPGFGEFAAEQAELVKECLVGVISADSPIGCEVLDMLNVVLHLDHTLFDEQLDGALRCVHALTADEGDQISLGAQSKAANLATAMVNVYSRARELPRLVLAICQNLTTFSEGTADSVFLQASAVKELSMASLLLAKPVLETMLTTLVDSVFAPTITTSGATAVTELIYAILDASLATRNYALSTWCLDAKLLLALYFNAGLDVRKASCALRILSGCLPIAVHSNALVYVDSYAAIRESVRIIGVTDLPYHAAAKTYGEELCLAISSLLAIVLSPNLKPAVGTWDGRLRSVDSENVNMVIAWVILEWLPHLWDALPASAKDAFGASLFRQSLRPSSAAGGLPMYQVLIHHAEFVDVAGKDIVAAVCAELARVLDICGMSLESLESQRPPSIAPTKLSRELCASVLNVIHCILALPPILFVKFSRRYLCTALQFFDSSPTFDCWVEMCRVPTRAALSKLLSGQSAPALITTWYVEMLLNGILSDRIDVTSRQLMENIYTSFMATERDGSIGIHRSWLTKVYEQVLARNEAAQALMCCFAGSTRSAQSAFESSVFVECFRSCYQDFDSLDGPLQADHLVAAKFLARLYSQTDCIPRECDSKSTSTIYRIWLAIACAQLNGGIVDGCYELLKACSIASVHFDLDRRDVPIAVSALSQLYSLSPEPFPALTFVHNCDFDLLRWFATSVHAHAASSSTISLNGLLRCMIATLQTLPHGSQPNLVGSSEILYACCQALRVADASTILTILDIYAEASSNQLLVLNRSNIPMLFASIVQLLHREPIANQEMSTAENIFASASGVLINLFRFRAAEIMELMPSTVSVLRSMLHAFREPSQLLDHEQRAQIRDASPARLFFDIGPLSVKSADSFTRTLESLVSVPKTGADTHVKSREHMVGRHVVHLLAEFVAASAESQARIFSVQVKDALFPGFCALFELCDEYQQDMMMAHLGPASKVTLKTFHSAYLARYKFRGKA